MARDRGHFSRLGFILAAAGSAVGLGNLWKFSYIVHENDGGSFVLVYLLAVLVVGFPIMMAEIVIGRSTQKSPVGAFLKLGHPLWSFIGWLGIAAGFLILSYYNIVAGWTIQYFIKCLGWSLKGMVPDTVQLSGEFETFLSDGPLQILFHALFMGMTVFLVIRGVNKGIEKSTRIMMPALFIILLILVVNSIFTEGFTRAVSFLFKPSQLKPDSVLEAVGQAFFSLSLGMGAIITYGSYMGKKESIPRAAAMVCLTDTLIALMASVVMFSMIFSVPDFVMTKSTGILFNTVPYMFYKYLPGGIVLAPLFFILVAFAALTSTISLLEVVVSYFIDQLSWPRKRATLIVGFAIFSFGVLSALSLGGEETLTQWNPLAGKSRGVFDTSDYLATNWMLPVGAIFIAIYTGWVLKARHTKIELETGHGEIRLHWLWIFLLRFVAPLAVGYILYAVIFLGKSFH